MKSKIVFLFAFPIVLFFFNVPFALASNDFPSPVSQTDSSAVNWTLDTCNNNTSQWDLWDASTGNHINSPAEFCYWSGSGYTTGTYAQSYEATLTPMGNAAVGEYVVTHSATNVFNDTGFYDSLGHFRTYQGFIEEFSFTVCDDSDTDCLVPPAPPAQATSSPDQTHQDMFNVTIVFFIGLVLGYKIIK